MSQNVASRDSLNKAALFQIVSCLKSKISKVRSKANENFVDFYTLKKKNMFQYIEVSKIQKNIQCFDNSEIEERTFHNVFPMFF